MIQISHLLKVVDAYRVATGTSETTVSHRVFRDTKKVRQLREGGDMQIGRFNEALVWFSSSWPEGAIWPADVERPAPVVQPSEAAE
ncbi:hypothetical protein [Mesorhizobium sp. ANAO-SY3R2]|uniref:hypothetical protein n=1 Tax=Mesorhizobium sp. ANAO-SY3R2 TaxID=3166644 RepID=UPI00366F9466